MPPAAPTDKAPPLARALRPLLRVLPSDAAFALTRTLASLPGRSPLKERDRAALARARAWTFHSQGSLRRAWSWGDGPPVVLVHGWGGHAAQMAPLAEDIAARGFRAVAFDAHAHGRSPGRSTSFRDFIADSAAVVRALGAPVQACVGHSAGGLGMMAAREREGLAAGRYVCINAPRWPYVPVEMIDAALRPPAALRERCIDHYTSQFDCARGELQAGCAYRRLDDADLLLVYDHDDDRVRHGDGEAIAAAWPGARLLKTRGLGHNGVLWNADVIAAVGAFVAQR